MPVKKLKTYLDDANVKYLTLSHSSAFTSQDIAASAHVSGKEFAKTVMIKIDGVMATWIMNDWLSHRFFHSRGKLFHFLMILWRDGKKIMEVFNFSIPFFRNFPENYVKRGCLIRNR